ncbi:hypothetical protein [Streptomyces mirabilis]|uniref:hypothetical protein n=1 Tax=Streptomyces mirabilis TaxID=68239 RepID=UPI0033BC8821
MSCHWLREPDKRPYYLALKPLLDTHAEQLVSRRDGVGRSRFADQREAYANDLGDARALIAVSAASNRPQQSRPGPQHRQPPAQGYRCQYATDWVADNTRWGLVIDPTEHAALSQALSNCPDQPITVTLAR